MLGRPQYLLEIEANNLFPAIALVGPRQVGKTTLAKEYLKNLSSQSIYFDLEDPDDFRALRNPKPVLENLTGTVAIDEVQVLPELFAYLRSIIDKRPDLQFLLLGSATPALLSHGSESLAGRIGYVEVKPFSLLEYKDYTKLWVRGGFPRSILAASDKQSLIWRKNFVKTFLEQDLASQGFKLNPQMLRKFWVILADYHAQIFNASELARALDLDIKTIKRYLDILVNTFMVRYLAPWHENISKRQVKNGKIFLRDSGLLHFLLGIEDFSHLIKSRKLGSSWEGYAIEQIITYHQADYEECYFWATQGGAELDLLIAKDGKKYAFEIKFSQTPTLTKSMKSAIDSLQLAELIVIVPGDGEYYLNDKVRVVGLNKYVMPTSAINSR
jgi:predicted AAA+ superfamily ATPase